MVRAKMRLQHSQELVFAEGPLGNRQKKLIFVATYDPTIPEDQAFQKATPNAEATFQIDNPAALAQLEIGKDYYFDISPVDVEAPKA